VVIGLYDTMRWVDTASRRKCSADGLHEHSTAYARNEMRYHPLLLNGHLQEGGLKVFLSWILHSLLGSDHSLF